MRKRKKSNDEIEEIVRFVHDKGGINYARSIMDEYAQRALDELSTLPESPERKSFEDLITFIIERKK